MFLRLPFSAIVDELNSSGGGTEEGKRVRGKCCNGPIFDATVLVSGYKIIEKKAFLLSKCMYFFV